MKPSVTSIKTQYLPVCNGSVRLHPRCACCVLWGTTCSRATDLRRLAVAGWRWTTQASLLASWAVMYPGSSTLSTVTLWVQTLKMVICIAVMQVDCWPSWCCFCRGISNSCVLSEHVCICEVSTSRYYTSKETDAPALIRLYLIWYSPILQFWRQVYLLTVLSLILAVFCAQVHPRYLSNDWRRIRMTIFCCVAGISVIPACHWVWLNGGFTSDVVQVRKYNNTTKQVKWEHPYACSHLFLHVRIHPFAGLLRSVMMSWLQNKFHSRISAISSPACIMFGHRQTFCCMRSCSCLVWWWCTW